MASMGINPATRRSLMTSSFTRAALPRSSSQIVVDKSKLTQTFRRNYAEIQPTAPVVPVKKRRFRVLRWAWRITYLSVIGGVVYLGYTIYELRNPEDQFEQDPAKQNLVILGMHLQILSVRLPTNCFYRHWLGSCFSPKEARH